MKRTTLRQKVVLLAFGILLALLLLEGSLRIGGFIFELRQDLYNQKSLSNKNKVFRILCIGESTTALGGENSFPYQLENILNSKGLGRTVEVINKGLVSKTSADILAELDANLKKIKPDLVVSMIGINDAHLVAKDAPLLAKIDASAELLRVYKFLKLIVLGLQQKYHGPNKKVLPFSELEKESSGDLADANKIGIMEQELFRDQLTSDRLRAKIQKTENTKEKENLEVSLAQLETRTSWGMVYLARCYRERGDYEKAKIYLQRAIVEHPENYGAYIELGRDYKDQKDFNKAIAIFQQAIDIGGMKAMYAFVEMGRCYDELKDYNLTFKIYNFVFEQKPQDFWIYPELGRWFKTHNHLAQAEAVFEEAIKRNPRDYSLYESLAEVYLAQGKKEQAQKLYNENHLKASEEQTYSLATINNYNQIAEMVLSRRIGLICMQYPMRSAEPLKDMLQSKDRIIFVENKVNFEKALIGGQYPTYFSDNFAGNFGHCTRKGNQLIAENLANTIVEKYFH